MSEAISITWEDICHHTPHCTVSKWIEIIVPNHRIYHQAFNWLFYERKQRAVKVSGVYVNDKHTGEYRFSFLCEQEALIFALQWL